MKSAVQRDETAPLFAPVLRPVLERKLDRHLHGRRAVVAVKDVAEALRRELYQPLGELGRRLMGDAGERGVAEALGLLAERRDQPWMAVAEHGGPPRCVGIDVGRAVEVVEARPFARSTTSGFVSARY